MNRSAPHTMTDPSRLPALAASSAHRRPRVTPSAQVRGRAFGASNGQRPSRQGRRALLGIALSVCICGGALLLPRAVDAAPLTAGSVMPALALTDQHDAPASIGPSTRWVIFAADKPVSDMVGGVLAAEPAGVTDRLRLVYVADISGMPALVTRMFALPRLRELKFPIALVRDAAQVAQVADIPREAGAATVLSLEDGRIAKVSLARTPAELRALLGLPAPRLAP